MKQIIKLCFFVAITALTVSCSSSDSSSGSSAGPNSGTLSVNGTAITLSDLSAQRSENTFAFSANGSDDSYLEFTFNASGNLEKANFMDADGNDYYSYKHFNSNYFTFNLISVDTANKTIRVSYSGKVYLDDEDLSSPFKTIGGSFNVPYVEFLPSVPGLGLNCKIAGNNWQETRFWDNGFSDIDRNFISDDANMIIMKFANSGIAPGTYNFTPLSSSGFELAKYNTTTKVYDNYNCTGTFTITSNGMVSIYTIIQGTFSFTATNVSNPAQQIVVSNGTFKTNI